MTNSILALVLRNSSTGARASVETLSDADLPTSGEVLIRVSHSSLNYKDALAVSGEGKVVRADYPFVPGIDLVGEIVETESSRFQPGDWVIATGGGLGETSWGGYATRQRISAEWLVPLPGGLSPRHAMVIGTAGLTAMLSLIQLERMGQRPENGPVVVTGASGGVGSLSVLILSTSGYEVVAASGKSDAYDYLHSLGASRVVDRSEFGSGADRPLDSAKWAGAIDTVGGTTLETIVSQTARHGGIAVCGLAGDAALNTTVFPFILRGVNLLGIDSNTCPVSVRIDAWQRMAALLDRPLLDRIGKTIPLADIPARSHELLKGRLVGRTVVDVLGAE